MMKRVGNIGDKSKREARAMTRILVVSYKEMKSMVRNITIAMTS